MQTILSGFLAANLLPIGEDDEKLKLLESAAEYLSKEINDEPLRAYRFAMVGFDENVATIDPVHERTADVIATKWQTMTNKTGGSPVQIHRAVLLRAIEISAASNRDLRHAVTLVAQNLKPGTLNGKGTDCIAVMLGSWESSVAEELTEAWVNSVDMALPKLSGKVKKATLSKDELTASLGRASGPSDKEGNAYPTPNPHWPNAANPWSYEFAPRAAEAILAAIHAGSKSYAEDMQVALRETVSGWATSLERLAMREAKTELLWIRESNYSPSAKTSYKQLEPMNVALHAVIDVSRTVTKLAPPSVEYFLRDLVAQQAPQQARLADMLNAISPKFKAMPEGQSIFTSEKLTIKGRRSWLDCAVRGMDTGAFAEHTGVPDDYESALGDIAVQFYRELQIRKLLVAKS